MVLYFPWSALKSSKLPQGPIKHIANRGTEINLGRQHMQQYLATGPRTDNQGTDKEADPSKGCWGRRRAVLEVHPAKAGAES